MATRWYVNELVRAVLFGLIWSLIFYLMRHPFVWQSGILVAVVWFGMAALAHMRAIGSSVKPVLLSLVATLAFFVVWIGAVLFGGGDATNGIVIGLLVAALFGFGYYMFIYVLPNRPQP